MEGLGILLYLLFWVGIIVLFFKWGTNIAERKGYDGVIGGLAGAIGGIVGIIIMYIIPNKLK